MNYEQALKKLVDTNGTYILNYHFKTYCILSDYIGCDPYSNKLNTILFEVNKVMDVYYLFKFEGFNEARNKLKEYYLKNKDKYLWEDFTSSINPVSSIICPIDYKIYLKNKKQNTNNAKVVINRANNSNKGSKVNITNKPTSGKIISNNNKATNLYGAISNRPVVNKLYYQKLDSIDIVGRVASITICYDSNDEVRVYQNSNKKPIDLNRFTYHNSKIYLDLLYPRSNIIVSIPKRDYQSININSDNANITIKDKLTINNLDINTICGDVDINTISKKVNIKTTNGKIKLVGQVTNLEAYSTNGNILFDLETNNLTNMSIIGKTTNGIITGRFKEGVLRPKVTKLFGKTKLINIKSNLLKCKVGLFLSTNKGFIDIR